MTGVPFARVKNQKGKKQKLFNSSEKRLKGDGERGPASRWARASATSRTSASPSRLRSLARRSVSSAASLSLRRSTAEATRRFTAANAPVAREFTLLRHWQHCGYHHTFTPLYLHMHSLSFDLVYIIRVHPLLLSKCTVVGLYSRATRGCLQFKLCSFCRLLVGFGFSVFSWTDCILAVQL